MTPGPLWEHRLGHQRKIRSRAVLLLRSNTAVQPTADWGILLQIFHACSCVPKGALLMPLQRNHSEGQKSRPPRPPVPTPPPPPHTGKSRKPGKNAGEMGQNVEKRGKTREVGVSDPRTQRERAEVGMGKHAPINEQKEKKATRDKRGERTKMVCNPLFEMCWIVNTPFPMFYLICSALPGPTRSHSQQKHADTGGQRPFASHTPAPTSLDRHKQPHTSPSADGIAVGSLLVPSAMHQAPRSGTARDRSLQDLRSASPKP